jgi:hypothetical protein
MNNLILYKFYINSRFNYLFCFYIFNQVILLSLMAGGVGLNLVGANHLILMEPHWNPQLEIQAQDRIYRIGQKNTVRIYKYVIFISEISYLRLKDFNFVL